MFGKLKQNLVIVGTGALLAISSMAYAVPVIYFGEDLNPGATVPAGGNAETARNDFLSGLSGVGNEDFEGFALGSIAPLSLSFPGSTGSITATLNGDGRIESAQPFAGRFPTSGSNWWEVSGDFSIVFSDPISAFGFYGTDIGDFDGQVTLQLTNGTTVDLTVPNTTNAPNGSLLFYGFIDATDAYTGITFGNTAAGTDFFGFDDMVIGDRGQINVPEPAMIALLGIGLAGIGFSRRR